MAEKFKLKRLKKNQIYYMYFDSGNREYFAIGKNVDLMAENILRRYNKYCMPCDEYESLEHMVINPVYDDWEFNTYIVDLDSASDMDYRNFDNEVFIGNYLQKVRGKYEKHLSE